MERRLHDLPHSSCTSIEHFSIVYPSTQLSSTIHVHDQSVSFPAYVDHFAVPAEQCCLLDSESITMLDGDQLMIDEVEDISEWFLASQQHCLDDDDGGSLLMSSISSKTSMDVLSNQTSLILPSDDMEIDNELSILNLLKAYGEATMELETRDLAQEITLRLRQKGCPIGSNLQRLAYYFTQALDKETDFLRQESSKNYESAFRAFYHIFPYGRFAHFTANSVILEAIPADTQMVHIVDFDIDSGVQWPPLIEALARRGQRIVRLIALKWDKGEGNSNACVLPTPRFEETKIRLHEHARNFGLRLEVVEMNMEGLVSEMKKTEKRGGRSSTSREWLAFNCMVVLPHMGKSRSVKSVIEFLKVAKDSISLNCGSSSSSSSSRGTITFGDGIGWGKRIKGLNGYGSIFEGQLVQFQALLESMDCHFPKHLKEARITIECLFMIPYMSILIDQQIWEEIGRESKALCEVGLEGWRMGKEIVMEAKELVREGESSYWVNIEGVMENQMVLGYMGTPLLKVSSWK